METYLPDQPLFDLEEAAGRARAAAERLADGGTPIRYLRSILLPDEETCFHLYQAESEASVVEASRLAGFSSPRILEAVVLSGHQVGQP